MVQNNLISLIVAVGGLLILLDQPVSVFSSKCATLYSINSYQGNPYSFPDGTKQPYLRQMNFVPRSVRVTKGCNLTVYLNDQKRTFDQDQADLGNSYQILDASCCQCGNCVQAARDLGGLCARLYESTQCNNCEGFRLDLKDGDKAKSFGPLSKKMTSVALRPGCTLTVFSEPMYNGYRFNFTDSYDIMGNNWYKQISSAICGCNTGNMHPTVMPTLPTIPTTRPWTTPIWTTTRYPWITLPTEASRPPMTLPTVPTTRPVMTLPTVPTTRPVLTLPTVQTTRPVMTLPTVPTTRPAMTLPTVPTTRPVITLPTVPPSEEKSDETEEDDYEWEKEDNDDDWFGEDNSDEIDPIITSTTTTTTTTTTTPKTTTTVRTTTTTEKEEEEDDDDWW